MTEDSGGAVLGVWWPKGKMGKGKGPVFDIALLHDEYMIRSAFYPRDAMLARVFAIATCLSVRLSVCLSVTRRYCAYQSESRIVKCIPSDSPITLVSG